MKKYTQLDIEVNRHRAAIELAHVYKQYHYFVLLITTVAQAKVSVECIDYILTTWFENDVPCATHAYEHTVILFYSAS